MSQKIKAPEEARELPEGLIKQTGACRFCGQMKMYTTSMPWSDEKLNEAATRECDCEDAKRYAKRMETKEKAENAARALFSENSKLQRRYHVCLDKGLEEFMIEIVNMISEGKLCKCTIDEGRVRIRIWLTAKGEIKLKWIYTDEEEESA